MERGDSVFRRQDSQGIHIDVKRNEDAVRDIFRTFTKENGFCTLERVELRHQLHYPNVKVIRGRRITVPDEEGILKMHEPRIDEADCSSWNSFD